MPLGQKNKSTGNGSLFLLLFRKLGVKVYHIAKRYMTWRLYKPWKPHLSQGIFWEWVRPMDFCMVSERVPWRWWTFPSRCWTRAWSKSPHLRGRVKVSHIVKRYMIWRLCKLWTPLLSQGVFWEWVRPIDFYMVLEWVPWTMMSIFLLMLNTCLTKVVTREGAC
jgi:hypothetical protein